MEQKETITIGIPSYNEGQNLIKVLEQLKNISPKCRENIVEIIISDDSDDETPKILKNYLKSQKYPYRVRFIHHTQRRGQASAWNEVFKESKGDYIILYDADIIIDKKNPCKLIEKLKNNSKIGIVGGRTISLKRYGFAAEATRIIGGWLHIIRRKYPESQYTLMGRCICIRKELAKKIRIPKGIIADDLYLQCKIKELGYNIDYVEKAIILFKPPLTIKEFISQVIRGVVGHKQINKYIINYIPQKIKTEDYIETIYQLIKDYGIISTLKTLIAFTLGIPYLPLIWRNTINHIWMIAETSK